MVTGRRVRETRIVSGQVRSARHWEGEPREETRQEYANIRSSLLIVEFAAAGERVPFDVLLLAFRSYGVFYDAGQRLRDLKAAA